VASAITTAPVSAQSIDDIRDELRRGADRVGFGEAIQGLTGFASFPGVSAANFTVGGGEDTSDTDISKYNLPLSHQFSAIGTARIAPYGELTFGYLRSQQSAEFLAGTPIEAKVDSRLKSYSVIGGVGPAFALTENTTLRPIALLGYSRIEDDSDLSGPSGAVVEEAGDGLLFNWHVNTALYGGALEIEHTRMIGEDVGISSTLRYNYLWANTFDASDPVLETISDFGVFTANLEVDGPTGLTPLGRQLRWIGFVANSAFTESEGLDIEYFFEIGGGIEVVDRTVIEGLEGISLRASAIVGAQDVTGWSVSAKLEF
jgi:hypothetical protein